MRRLVGLTTDRVTQRVVCTRFVSNVVSQRKLALMLEVLRVRELSAARGITSRSSETSIVVPLVQTSEITLQPDDTMEDAGLEEDTTPLPSTFSEEEREINVPLLGEHIKVLASVPSLFQPHVKQRLRQREVSGTPLTGVDADDGGDVGTVLEGRNLSQLDLSKADLSASFNRANLRYTSFDICRIWSATFDGADMRRASLQGAEVRNCTFVAADLQSADLSGARFTNCRFIRCNLRRSTLHSAIFHNCDFTMADLSDACVNPHTFFFHPEGWGVCRRLNWISPAADAPNPRVTLPPNAKEVDRVSLPAGVV